MQRAADGRARRIGYCYCSISRVVDRRCAHAGSYWCIWFCLSQIFWCCILAMSFSTAVRGGASLEGPVACSWLLPLLAAWDGPKVSRHAPPGLLLLAFGCVFVQSTQLVLMQILDIWDILDIHKLLLAPFQILASQDYYGMIWTECSEVRAWYVIVITRSNGVARGTGDMQTDGWTYRRVMS